jgi:hypothetical protein
MLGPENWPHVAQLLVLQRGREREAAPPGDVPGQLLRPGALGVHRVQGV